LKNTPSSSGSGQPQQAALEPRTRLFFEDVSVGMDVPPLVKKPTAVTLFMYGVSIWATHRIHYDKPHARSEGYKDIVVHGPLQAAWLAQMLSKWTGDPGFVKKFSYSHRTLAYPGDTLTCQGTVRAKRQQDGRNLVDCDLWIENQHGERPTIGQATLALPTRPNPGTSAVAT